MQITEQSRERLLVGVIHLPVLEIPDVALLWQQRRPAVLGLLDRRIDTNWEQHLPTLTPLPRKRDRDFGFHPAAGERGRRQDQQQALVCADRLVNLIKDAVADLQIMRCEPTAHAVRLEVRREATRDGLIMSVVGDEARGP